MQQQEQYPNVNGNPGAELHHPSELMGRFRSKGDFYKYFKEHL